MSNTTALVGQTLGQPRALALSSSRTARRPSGSIKFTAGSSSGTQSTQRPQRMQTRIYDMTPLKNKLIIKTPLGERMVRTSVFKRCEVVVEGMVLKDNLIPLEMTDFDVILGMDWLSNHRASMNCFTKKIRFEKPRYSEFEFVGDRKFLPTCVISALEVRDYFLKGVNLIWLM